MPQRFYIDDSDLKGQLTKLDENLYEMLDFAYLHEDMVNTIDELMSEWGKLNITTFKSRVEEYNNLPKDQKQYYDNIDEWLSENQRWWLYEFDNLSDESKKIFIQRYRLTISICLHSSTFDYKVLNENIEKGWKYIYNS